MWLDLTSLRFSRASTTSLPSLRFLRVGWKRWLDAHRPRRCTPSRRDARSVSRRAARDPATHTRPIPSAPGRHEHLTATHLASGCDRCTHLMNSTRIPHAGRLADVRLHLTSLGVTRSAPSLPCPSLQHTRCRVDARVRCYDLSQAVGARVRRARTSCAKASRLPGARLRHPNRVFAYRRRLAALFFPTGVAPR